MYYYFHYWFFVIKLKVKRIIIQIQFKFKIRFIQIDLLDIEALLNRGMNIKLPPSQKTVPLRRADRKLNSCFFHYSSYNFIA